MEKKKTLILVGLGLLLILTGMILSKPTKEDENTNTAKKDTNQEQNISVAYYFGDAPKFISGDFAGIEINSDDDIYKALDKIKDKLKFKNAKEEFKIVSINENNGYKYYKLAQLYKGIEVYGNNMVISVDKNKHIQSYSGYYAPNIDVDVDVKIDTDKIENIVKKDLGENPKIVEMNKYIYTNHIHNDMGIIYKVIGYSDTNAKEYIVNAEENRILSSSNLFDNISLAGIGLDGETHSIMVKDYHDTLQAKTRYKLIDEKRNIYIYDMKKLGMISGLLISSLEDKETGIYMCDVENGRLISEYGDEDMKSAVSAMYNYETIYDFYKSVLNRNSYDDKGSKIQVNIGLTQFIFTDKELKNAAWNRATNEMYIGDYNGKSFTASLDVLAHEFTHGVVQNIVSFASAPVNTNSTHSFETGAISEGIADIFGVVIEGKNWTIAENNETLRDIANPSNFKNPAKKDKEDEFYYPEGYLKNRTLDEFLNANNLKKVYDYDGGGSHHNSTIVSHSAYLMYTNGAFSSMEEMAKVWYNALFMMTPYTDFEDCALAVIRSAEMLGLSDKSIGIIYDAFFETKMLEPKDYKLTITVMNTDGKFLPRTIVEVYDKDSKLVDKIPTDENGGIICYLKRGKYTLKVSNSNYNIKTVKVNMIGETELIIKLDKGKKESKCENSSNCHVVKVYTIDSIDDTGVNKSVKEFEVEDGYSIGEKLEKYIGNSSGTYKNDSLSWAWYYKGTNEEFDLNTPIHEDIELEVKLSDGELMYDLEDMEDMYDLVNSDEFKDIMELMP